MAKMKFDIKKQAPNVIGLTVGNVAAGFASKLIPLDNAYLKNGIALVAGVMLMGQKGLLSNVGAGMASAAGANILRTAVPAIGDLEDEISGVGADDDFIITGGDDDDDDISGTVLNGTVLNGPEDEDDDFDN